MLDSSVHTGGRGGTNVTESLQPPLGAMVLSPWHSGQAIPTAVVKGEGVMIEVHSELSRMLFPSKQL